jgi:hypothetical protein
MVSKEIQKYPKLRRIVRRKKRRQKMRNSIFEKFIILIILKKLFHKIFLELGILIVATKLSFNAGFEKMIFGSILTCYFGLHFILPISLPKTNFYSFFTSLSSSESIF